MVVSTRARNKEFVRGSSSVRSSRDINVYIVVESFVEQRQFELCCKGGHLSSSSMAVRSEERRVGKEGRSRGSPEH